jgi:hypothetical protein
MPGNKKYDLTVAYRIYPKVSKVPPVFENDKFKLSELCLYSFRKAIEGLKYKLIVLLDNCPDNYIKLFQDYFPGEDLQLISLPQSGNAKTFKNQVDLLLEQNYSENIYFAEDDYFYLDKAFPEMIDLLTSDNQVDFITPYNHPDYYQLDLHSYQYDSIEYHERIWRTAGSTCMTFMTTKKVLEKTHKIFLTYTKNNYDASIWLSVTKHVLNNPSFIFNSMPKNSLYRKIFLKSLIHTPLRFLGGRKWTLWAPVPSLSTHMDSKHLAPAIKWFELFQNTKEKLIFSH